VLRAEASEKDEEWEYEEYEMLREGDFYNSEWKVGTVWNTNRNKIEETWVRLIAADNQLKAFWGDGAEGKWSLDPASQFFSISKETFGGLGGKKIWAGVIDDYYFLEGTVRGWSPISSASVLGEWQAKRLGVDPEEIGIAPWFAEEEGEEGNESEKMDSDETATPSEVSAVTEEAMSVSESE